MSSVAIRSKQANTKITAGTVMRQAWNDARFRSLSHREDSRLITQSFFGSWFGVVAVSRLVFFLAMGNPWGLPVTDHAGHYSLTATIIVNLLPIDFLLAPLLSFLILLILEESRALRGIAYFRESLRKLKKTWEARSIRGVAKAQRNAVQEARVAKLEIEVATRDYVAEKLAEEARRLAEEQERVRRELREREQAAAERQRFVQQIVR